MASASAEILLYSKVWGSVSFVQLLTSYRRPHPKYPIGMKNIYQEAGPRLGHTNDKEMRLKDQQTKRPTD
jgi:hypothetical protein